MLKNRLPLAFFLTIILSLGFLCLLVFLFGKPNVDFNPQQIQKYKITDKENNPLDILANILPQFVLNLSDQKYKNIFQANAAEKSLRGNVVDIKGDSAFSIDSKIDEKTKQVVFTPRATGNFKPGLYKLNVNIKTYKGEDITVTQDFTWGVIAINTNKAVYRPGEQVNFAMTVLDEFGKTKCIAKEDTIVFGTAKVSLQIISPTGEVQNLSTGDGSIVGSKSCADRSVTNEGDFLAKYITKDMGKYIVHMEAETLLGKKKTEYSFLVSGAQQAFEIERTVFPTRIFPYAKYPVEIMVKANKDYSGPVYDRIPQLLKIAYISANGKIIKYDNYQVVEWQVNFKKGQTYVLKYVINFPRIVPEFYLVGPLKIDKFSEGKEWQIASDAIFQFIQEKHAIGTATTVNAVFTTTPTVGNLVITICYRASSGSFSTPTPGTWTSAYNNSSGSPRIYMYYRIVPVGMTATVGCRVTTSTAIGTQIIEFSGVSPTGTRDTPRSRRNSFSCTTANAATAITPTNPDVLAVAAFAATGTTSVSSHSVYTDSATSFNQATGTFDSSWLEVINNPPIATTDTANYAASGTTCADLLVDFNPTFSIAQGSYRFFDNPNNIMVGTPLAPANTIMQLGYPNYPFRIRFLLDVDSPSGTILGALAGDFVLQYATLSAQFANCGQIVNWDPVSTAANGSDIAFKSNPDSGGNGTFISSSGNDPSDGPTYTTVYESYYEDDINGNAPTLGNITNDQAQLGNNQAGLWDLSLVDNTDDTISRHYCLRVVNADLSLLDAYRNYPQVITVQTDVTIRSGSYIRGSTTIR